MEIGIRVDSDNIQDETKRHANSSNLHHGGRRRRRKTGRGATVAVGHRPREGTVRGGPPTPTSPARSLQQPQLDVSGTQRRSDEYGAVHVDAEHEVTRMRTATIPASPATGRQRPDSSRWRIGSMPFRRHITPLSSCFRPTATVSEMTQWVEPKVAVQHQLSTAWTAQLQAVGRDRRLAVPRVHSRGPALRNGDRRR